MTTSNVMFDRTVIEAEIVTLQALVDSIKEKRGNASARIRKAIDQALTEEVTFGSDTVPTYFLYGVNEDESEGAARLVDIAQYVVDITTWAEQLRDERVALILKGETNSDNTAVLKEQYTAKRNLVEAMLTLCQAQGIDVSDIKVPHVGGGRPPGSQNAATKKPGSKWSRFYRVVNGERKDQSDSQNTLSSFCYYHGAKMMQTDSRPATSDLTAWLKGQGVDSPIGKSWSLEVNGITYGNDVSDSTPEATESVRDDDKAEEE